MMERRAFLIALAGAAAACGARPKVGGGAFEAAVDEIAEGALKGRSIPGLSVAVMRGPELILAKGYGVADAGSKTPAAPETIYQLGSISKQFTAAAVMRLAERGRVRLDDPLTNYLPDYPTRGRTILVRHLLQQTSGIKEFFTVPGFAEAEAAPPEKFSRDDLIDLFKKEPFQFAPGERWAYSNSNYTLLGRVIEIAAGQTYAEHLEESLFRPLKLDSTRACATRPAADARFARGHTLRAAAPAPAPHINMNTAVGDGNLCSSVLDLARWGRALASGEAIGRASYERMITPDAVARGYTPAYGFGLSLVPLDGRRRVGHNGEVGGFTGALAHYPEHDLTTAVLTNLNRIWPEAIEKAVTRAALGLRAPAVNDLPLGDDERRRYAGTYDFGVFPVKVSDEGGRLVYDTQGFRPKYELLSQGGGKFVARDEPDAIGLTFSPAGMGADKLTIEMAAMHWYAERVGE